MTRDKSVWVLSEMVKYNWVRYPIRIDPVPEDMGGGFMAYLVDFGPDTVSGEGCSAVYAVLALASNVGDVFDHLSQKPGYEFPEPSPPGCAKCGHDSTLHVVDDEERRECGMPGCPCCQYRHPW